MQSESKNNSDSQSGKYPLRKRNMLFLHHIKERHQAEHDDNINNNK